MGTRKSCAWVIGFVLITQLGLVGCTGNGAADLVDEAPEARESASAGPTSTGAVTLTWYTFPDGRGGSPGQAELADSCIAGAGGRYTIEVEELSGFIEDQAAQVEAAIAAGEPVDLMSLDTTLLADFAAAGYFSPLRDADQARLRDTMLTGPLRAQTVDGQVVAFPLASNTQLLWYRKSVERRAGLELSRPVTWRNLIAAAESARTTVQVQAGQYEGYTVWLNSLIEGAGGDLLEPDSPAGRVMSRVVHGLATSPAGDPELESTTELETHERFFSEDGGFMVNWPYILHGRWRDDAARDQEDLGWARYPRTVAGRPARPPLAAVGLAVADGSEHRRLAMRAARCLSTREHQISYMLSYGWPSGLASVYDDPSVRQAFPMADLLRTSLQSGAPRPETPNYWEVSTALQEVLWPPEQVDPQSTPRQAQRAVDAAIGVVTG